MKKQTLLLKLALIIINFMVLVAATIVVPTITRSTRWDFGIWVWPFSIGLYAMLGLVLLAITQAWQLLKLIDHQAVFTAASVIALTWIKRDAYSVALIFTVLLPFFYIWVQAEDAPGLLLLAIILTGIALVIGLFANILAQLLASAIQIKAENELTI
ncbi:DUF2975 domain-containing protein [Lactiplantibacillus sp. WILCCON 0030]|uniref:DUF2975 domain-containing protein n=1 Tax=Lactiplantibacillus brownii TaxID=3069269 RepID=A0ABU1ADD1_9LACO|nr:DUF2975 domain-containing protein [Lactiplantibacillus brownii]MDQ7938437.1 DUF2975 domain-containing protein [Lactiplantibacillus brownii]